MARFRYQHIKSSVEGKAPTAAQIKVAEIGVNDFAGDEKLFIKNSAGEVVDFPRGYSQAYIDETERVTAEALNDLNERKLDASAYTPTDLSNYYTKDETSGATEIQDALDEKLDASAYTPTDLSNYYTKDETSGSSEIQDALDEKADISDIPSVDGYADSVKYNSETQYVEFYHGTTAGTKVFEYDASPFLIDGMVESVAITSVTSGGSDVQVLEITWNSAAGSQVTDIPISDIFDSNLYYTKSETSGATEISAALADKSNTGHTHDDRYYTKSEIDEFEETTAAALNDLENNKQDKLTAGTGIDITNNVISVTGGGSADVDEELEVIAASLNDLENRKADKEDLDGFDEQLEVIATSLNDLENRKADKEEVDEQFEVIATSLNDLEHRKANEEDLEEIGETVAYALNDLECRKQNELTAGTGIDITNDVISVTGGGSADVEEELEVIATSLNDLESRKADKEDLDGFDEQLEVIATSLNDLENRKADKEDLDGFDEQLETVAASLNDLENRKADKEDLDGFDEQLEVIATSLNDLESRKANKLEDLDGIKLKKITQSDYDDLVSSGATDSNTLYIITG